MKLGSQISKHLKRDQLQNSKDVLVHAESSRQGVGTENASSNFAASHYDS